MKKNKPAATHPARTKEQCVFSCRPGEAFFPEGSPEACRNGCAIIADRWVCAPHRCPWFLTEEEYLQRQRAARMDRLQRAGVDDYLYIMGGNIPAKYLELLRSETPAEAAGKAQKEAAREASKNAA